ncbi:YtxH domain-containing protein [Psychrobacillus sp. NEAU-3TGS]|uniref:YtxH domain-containing protein n=1 Tax=Psychrobacillus sp. NEAU-3TGS TaxID=2995412 RepID=UPI002499A249|nr:YtxH domain-containing protein [Psychrobacillus sp. NEAU-3TGS]MDI2587109.1 YtxH domain-containing protein [Psychrobacillus sp. NEAU-3TGS]
MSESKFVKGVVCGALIGGALTMLDNKTRNAVVQKTNSLGRQIKYYSTNRQELKATLEEQVTKWKSFYEQINSDATYISQKVNEVKEMTPQVKTLLTDTKEAFAQSKEEYKSIVDPESEEFIVKQ